MKKMIVVLSLLLSVDAVALRVEVPPRHEPEHVASQQRAEALGKALHAFTLEDGSVWVTHFVWTRRDPSSIGITRFDTDGSMRLFLLSDFLPPRSIPKGGCGQIYGVTTMTDGRLAVSGGWNDGRESHNAIVFLRPRKDGSFDLDRIMELPGVKQIAGGPNNSILAVTHDASRRHGDPILTIFNAAGIAIGALSEKGHLKPEESAQNASKARLIRLSPKRFALYEPDREQIFIHEVEVTGKEAVIRGVRGQFIGDDAELARLPVIGIQASADNNPEIIVVRTGKFQGRVGTHFTVYGGSGDVKQTASVDVPWNLMYREKDAIRGVYLRNDVRLDRVHLRDE